MYIWGVDGTSVDVPALNSALTVYDAVVDVRTGSASGQVYPSVSEALTDGHRSILVADGVHSPFTISHDNVSIHAIRRPHVHSGAIVSGARFTSQIRVQADGAHLSGLGVTVAGGTTGIRIDDGRGHIVEKCAVVGGEVSSGTGINVNAPIENLVIRGCELTNIGNGILIQPGSSDVVKAVTVDRNFVHHTGGTGIGILDAGDDAVHWRNVVVERNYLSFTAQNWGSGIVVQTAAGAQVLANHVEHAGSSGLNSNAHGIHVYAPYAIPYVRTAVIGNRVMFSQAYGIVMSSGTTLVSVTGNTSVGNFGANYVNCGGCPGYSLTGSYGTNVGS